MNFKKILSIIGGLTIVVPSTLSIVACGEPKINEQTIKDKKIIDDILGINFNLEVVQDSTLVLTNKTVTEEVVENLLKNAEIVKLGFDKNLLTEVKLNVSSDELKKVQFLNKKITFKYDDVIASNDHVKLKIAESNSHKIVDFIQQNAITTSVLEGANVKAWVNSITGEFIKMQYPKLPDYFVVKQYQTVSIVGEDGKELSDSSFNKAGVTITGTVNFVYDSITSKTKFTVNVNETNDEKIIDIIAAYGAFAADLAQPTSINEALSNISEYVKKLLVDEKETNFKNLNFDIKKFSIQSLVDKSGKAVKLETLQKIGKQDLYFSFKYGNLSVTTNPKIVITITESQSNKIIDDIVNSRNFKLDNVTPNADVNIITNKITGDFIKLGLPIASQKSFSAKDFKVISFKNVAGKDLSSSDLVTKKAVKVQIFFTYKGLSSSSRAATLIINVGTYTDYQMQEALKNSKPDLGLEVNKTADLKAGISAVVSYLNTEKSKTLLSNLDLTHQEQFKMEKLDFNNKELYLQENNHNKIGADFFANPTKSAQRIYFYVVYQDKPDASKPDGVFLAINVTIIK